MCDQNLRIIKFCYINFHCKFPMNLHLLNSHCDSHRWFHSDSLNLFLSHKSLLCKLINTIQRKSPRCLRLQFITVNLSSKAIASYTINSLFVASFAFAEIKVDWVSTISETSNRLKRFLLIYSMGLVFDYNMNITLSFTFSNNKKELQQGKCKLNLSKTYKT